MQHEPLPVGPVESMMIWNRFYLVVCAAVVLVTLVACGDDDSDDLDENGTTTTEEAAPSGAEEDELDPGSFPNEPQFSDDLSTCPDWILPSSCSDSVFTFSGVNDLVSVPVPFDVEPGDRGALMELAIISIEGQGEVGLACRSSFDTPFSGYALMGNYEDGWTLWRYEDGTREMIDSDLGSVAQNVGAGTEGRVVLRLGCGWGTGPGEQIGLLFSVNSQPLGPVTPFADENGLGVDDERSNVGIVALAEDTEDLHVELEELTLRLAE